MVVWVFAAPPTWCRRHLCGVGWLRDPNGSYDVAFFLAAGLGVVAAGLCGSISRRTLPVTGAAPVGAPEPVCLRFLPDQTPSRVSHDEMHVTYL